MADGLRIGVASVQGDVTEHETMVRQALDAIGRTGHVVPLRSAEDARHVDAAIIPGGESTTIAKLLDRFGASDVLVRRARDEDLPLLGTCAGAILLAVEGDDQVDRTRTRLLGLMDMAVDRNAFGRQRESFETTVSVDGVAEDVHAVFIRAPAILRTWGECRPLAVFQDRIVAARQGSRWALSFHPELTSDSRIHEAFLATV
jgi:5'-phosphate synthase pdxT subunit